MKKLGEDLQDFSGDEDFTKITFIPDFRRFGMQELEKDTFELFRKRVYDLSGVVNKKVSVYLNGIKIKVTGFKDYCSFYMKGMTLKESEEVKVAYTAQDRWELLVGASTGDFYQVSFVNSICTTRGGTHVDSILNKICESLAEEAQKRVKKKLKIKNSFIKNSIFIILNCLIENPAFDSQTKETLITKPSNFGTQIDLSDKFMKDLVKTGVIDQIVLQAQMKEELKMQKQLKGQKKTRLFGINKLEDANKAGTKDSLRCTLILTEGDSAKALAMAGLEVIGRDHYGVFPLRGKFLNVREASNETILKNQEVSSIIEIMGLRVGMKYQGDLSGLRYGSIMIMADQDHDGSHIKGLIINFIHHFWPDLIRSNNFLKEFVTPIIKVSKGNAIHTFFTVNDFKAWAEARVDQIKGWRVKYYKGLGTSDDKEAKEYFSNIEIHKINFKYDNAEDDEAVDLAFNKKKADSRKEWLSHFDPNVFVDHKVKVLRYYDFIHKELIQFSIANNHRAIPNLLDGLKTGQRKILFACFKRKLTKEIKVAQLSGYVAEHTEYHHGEQNLADTIIGMAQTFVGSNNIHLLMPNGQFGTRAMGGKDAASARYLHTLLNKVTRSIFLEADDHVLNYIEEDGKLVEPVFYMPIIPMALVNGCEGIGTGWSTSIPNFNPRELIENIRRRLDGEPFFRVHPYYKGYKGELSSRDEKSYNVRGEYIYNEDANTIDIIELPLHKWTSDYKKYIEEIIQDKNESRPMKIEDLREYHTSRQVFFRLILSSDQPPLNDSTLDKVLKLNSSMTLTNLVLFNEEGKINRYDCPADILERYYNLRLKYYDLRKDYLVSRIAREIEILQNKLRFIQEVNDDIVIISKRKKADIVSQLQRRNYTAHSKLPRIKSSIENNLIAQMNKLAEEAEADQGETGGVPREEPEEDQTDTALKEYNYLVTMNIISLSIDLVDKMKREVQAKTDEMQRLQARSVKEMWNEDLDTLVVELDRAEKVEAVEIAKDDKKAKRPPIDEKGLQKKKKKRVEREDMSSDNSFIVSKVKDKKKDKGTMDAEDKAKKEPVRIAGTKDGMARRTMTVGPSIDQMLAKQPPKPPSTAELDALIDSSVLKTFARNEDARVRLRKIVAVPLAVYKSKDADFLSLEERMYMKELMEREEGKSSTFSRPSEPRKSENLKDFFKAVNSVNVEDEDDEESNFNVFRKKQPKFRDESPEY